RSWKNGFAAPAVRASVDPLETPGGSTLRARTASQIMDPYRGFPPFSLTRLIRTTFAPKPGERVAILIDLPDPANARDFAFLGDGTLSVQRIAHDVFHR